MKLFLNGLIIGTLISLFPILNSPSASIVYSNWHGTLSNTANIKVSPNKDLNDNKNFLIKDNKTIKLLSKNGTTKHSYTVDNDDLLSLSSNGKLFVKYQKLSNEIELCNINGDRFWKIPSTQYPYISHTGQLILLLVADLSKVRIIDYNGNEIGAKAINGRICTSISFSRDNENAAIGFLDGNFYIINKNGNIIYNSTTPKKQAIKSMSLSNNGQNLAIHYGNTKTDNILSFNLKTKKSFTFKLPNTHKTKTAIHVTNNNTVSILNKNIFLILNNSENNIKKIETISQKAGHNAIKYSNGIYGITFSNLAGGSNLIIVDKQGNILLKKQFNNDPYLDCQIKDNTILARALNNLYCYNFEFQPAE